MTNKDGVRQLFRNEVDEEISMGDAITLAADAIPRLNELRFKIKIVIYEVKSHDMENGEIERSKWSEYVILRE